VVLALCRAASSAAQEAGPAPQPGTLQAAPPADAPADPLDRLVTLDMHDVPIAQAIQAVDEQAGLGLAYAEAVLPAEKRVTVIVSRVSAREALKQVLAGTGVVVKRSASGVLILAKGRSTRAAARGASACCARVFGLVTDSATGQPLGQVVVAIAGQDTSTSAYTTESGSYALSVPSGEYVLRVRYIGYVPLQRTIVLADSQALRVDFVLRIGMTKLQELVTTATGSRRRVELGNDITILDADSIVRTQAVTSITDLLATRVPGLAVLHTSGAPGDPARLRLRGVSSITGSNDPVIVVDGVRIYYAQTTNIAPGAGQLGPGGGPPPAPSPLDQIDPNSVQTIEVFKGPSAATMYGPDAANGVIVITTKKGQVGPPRWTASVERGLTYMPGRYPEGYFLWGHAYSNTAIPMRCSFDSAFCAVDSVSRFQALNDPGTTLLGNGNRTGVSVGVSGGASGLTYALTASTDDEQGLMRLPDLAANQFQAIHGNAPPNWMQHPQQLRRWSVTSRLGAPLGQKADVALSAMVTREQQQRSSLEGQLGVLMGTYIDRTTGTYYDGGTGATQRMLLSDFYTRTTDAATHFTNAVSLNWRPLSWATASADAGLDVVSRQDVAFKPRGMSLADDSVGAIGTGDGTSLMKTVNLRATLTAPLPLGFHLQTGFGANYSSIGASSVMVLGRDIPAGTSSVGSAIDRTVTDSRSEVATFGWYIEPTISHKRFWLSTGLRLDGGNTYGKHVNLAGFPKVSLSYLVSDEPWFPRTLKPVFNTLRLRVAYGHAGTQPGVSNLLRLYRQEHRFVDGRNVDVASIESLGNTQLKPERSTEFEGGFDADLAADRLSVGLTAYRKTKRDAILNIPVAPSVYGGGFVDRNIGTVRNTGLELTLRAQVVRSDLVTWSTDLNYTRNANRVVATNGGNAISLGSGQRIVAGYPVFGFWARPILGYADANGDGRIQRGEVVLGDSSTFVGVPEPRYEASMHSSVGLFRGAITIDAGLTYQRGLTQLNQALLQSAFFLRGGNDSSAPLGEQAAAAVLGGESAGGYTTTYGLYQTLSVLRLNSLSVAFNVSSALARRLGARAVNVAVQGTNLGLWTSYRGKDPDVNGASSGNAVADTGVLPQPRSWQLRVNVAY
jgi:TonB-linked SusC/RagA family outer membrane protein